MEGHPVDRAEWRGNRRHRDGRIRMAENRRRCAPARPDRSDQVVDLRGFSIASGAEAMQACDGERGPWDGCRRPWSTGGLSRAWRALSL